MESFLPKNSGSFIDSLDYCDAQNDTAFQGSSRRAYLIQHSLLASHQLPTVVNSELLSFFFAVDLGDIAVVIAQA